MRTDAKIGFAIGGVLLAVLTVYAIVVPKHSKKTTGTVSLVTPVTPSSSDTSSNSSTPPPFVAADQGSSSQQLPTPPVTTVKDPAVPAPVPTPAPVNNAVVDNNNGMIEESHNVLAPKDLAKIDDHKPGKLDGDVYTPAGHDRLRPNHGGAITPLPDDNDAIAATSERTYTIKPGQTLSKIAYEVYGNGRFWVAIQRENKGLDATHLKVGSKIHLPDISPVPGAITVADEEVVTPPAHEHTSAVSITDAHSYIVKSGDSLYGIAKRLLGSGRKAEALYALNKDVIGPDKSKLKLGMVLKLPEATRTALAN